MADWLDSIAEIIGGVGETYGKVEPLVKLGTGIYGMQEAKKQQERQIKARQEAEEALRAYQAEQQQYMAQLAGTGGGGSRISGRGLEEYRRQMAQAQGLLEPYAAAGQKMLPQMTDAYLQALNSARQLQQQTVTPEAMARINNMGGPAMSMPIIPVK